MPFHSHSIRSPFVKNLQLRVATLCGALVNVLAAVAALAGPQIQRPPYEVTPHQMVLIPNGAFACVPDRGTALTTFSPLPPLAGRDLDGFVTSSLRMTNDQCRATCASRNLAFAGTQSGNFCFCGNSIGSASGSAQCKSSCSGRPSEACGGSLANSISMSGALGFVPPPAPPMPQNGGQCVINVTGPAYQHSEVQTWTVVGMPMPLATGATLFTMTWNVTGGGRKQDMTSSGGQTMLNDRTWTIDMASLPPANTPPVTTVGYQARILNGVMTWGEQSPQGAGALHDHQQQYIDGIAQTPGTQSGQYLEWKPGGAYNFPVNPAAIAGTYTVSVDDAHPYGYARRPGSTGTISCKWNVAR
jgi:hypothetical protein